MVTFVVMRRRTVVPMTNASTGATCVGMCRERHGRATRGPANVPTMITFARGRLWGRSWGRLPRIVAGMDSSLGDERRGEPPC